MVMARLGFGVVFISCVVFASAGCLAGAAERAPDSSANAARASAASGRLPEREATPFRVELTDRPPFLAPDGCLTGLSDRNVMVGPDPSKACDYDTEDGFSISFDMPARDPRGGEPLPEPGDTFETRMQLPNGEYAEANARVTRLEPPFVWILISPRAGAPMPRGVVSFGGTMKVRQNPDVHLRHDPSAIVPEAIPSSQRLDPCLVTLMHTTYDRDANRPPTIDRHAVARIVRRWLGELRDSAWRDVAPLPLTLQQARTMLREPSESQIAGRPGPSIVVRGEDGTLQYHFDATGRTLRVDWDPNADSSSYEYEYRYECASTDTLRHPRYEDDPAAPLP